MRVVAFEGSLTPAPPALGPVGGILRSRHRRDPQVNLSSRSKLSLCQFLLLFRRPSLRLLLDKHGIPHELEEEYPRDATAALTESVCEAASATQLGNLVQEIARTERTLRCEVEPRYRFDQRWEDLLLCLELDGYRAERSQMLGGTTRIVAIEPTIDGAAAVDDDLSQQLQAAELPNADEIAQLLDSSATAFRDREFNACLTNARVGLQTLATAVAREQLARARNENQGTFDERRWGQVVAYLRTSGVITYDQEQGLTGVFSFLSPGAHTPIGFNEQEFARLGRSFAVTMCYFLAKRFNAGGGDD